MVKGDLGMAEATTLPVRTSVRPSIGRSYASRAPTLRTSFLADNSRLQRRFIGAIDQGTTSTRFIIFDDEGNLIASYQSELRRLHKYPG